MEHIKNKKKRNQINYLSNLATLFITCFFYTEQKISYRIVALQGFNTCCKSLIDKNKQTNNIFLIKLLCSHSHDILLFQIR